MSLKQFTDFMKSLATEDSTIAMQPTGSGAEVARSIAELKDVQGEEKIRLLGEKLSAIAKSKGFDVSEGDVNEYINSLKSQYELNPMVASMMDQYCSTSCHIGSAISAN